MVGAFHAPQPHLTISNVWDLLGPFQIGTREAVWGTDPLELFGGFRRLEFDPNARFKSSLAPHGTVEWSRKTIEPQTTNDADASVALEFDFPNVDWDLLKLAYGWSALQYQAWARGSIKLHSTESKSFEVYTDGVLEFWLDERLYFGGDFYSYRRAPLVVTLEPGRSYRIDLRLARDVRAMGGLGETTVRLRLELRAVTCNLFVDHEHIVAPDLVDDKLASGLLSAPLRNAGRKEIVVMSVVSTDSFWIVSPHHLLPLKIASGQTRPLPLDIAPSKESRTTVSIEVTYREEGQTQISTVCFVIELKKGTQRQPHKITFLGNGNTVSYALIRPPRQSLSENSSELKLPVFVYLHGAGVDADSEQNAKTLDGISDLPAWTIFASGVTSWCGDDWHQWGWPDVEAAVSSIPDWISNTGWRGQGVDLNKWIVAGHSNGGQGVWHALTHKPDKLLAAAPVSGYLSIQKYVPYTLWHETDPRRMSVLHASMNSYRHELLIANAYGIPILQQHGEKDDNVPCYHSRRMSQLIDESGWKSGYNEIHSKGHWFDDIMTTETLLKFYSEHAGLQPNSLKSLTKFTVVSANPADTSSKEGIRIQALSDPGMLGKIEVQIWESKASLTTFNVRSLSIETMTAKVHNIEIDGQDMVLANTSSDFRASYHRDTGDAWSKSSTSGTGRQSIRSGNQLGNLDAILRSRDYFVVQNTHDSTRELAIQTSRNLYQYFAADSQIINKPAEVDLRVWTGNLITLGVGTSIPHGSALTHPIRLFASHLCIRDHTGREREFKGLDHGLGAIFLRALEDERLEIVVWGTDGDNAAMAARLLPLITGTGQPDFVIMTRECLWKGVDGTLALGFFDSSWNVSSSSFIP